MNNDRNRSNSRNDWDNRDNNRDRDSSYSRPYKKRSYDRNDSYSSSSSSSYSSRDRDRQDSHSDDSEYRWNREGANIDSSKPYSNARSGSGYGSSYNRNSYNSQSNYAQPKSNSPFKYRSYPNTPNERSSSNDRKTRFIKRKPAAPFKKMQKKGKPRIVRKESPKHFVSLSRALAMNQVASRKIAIDIIKNARVQVNHAVVADPNTKVHSHRDRLMVDTMPLRHNREMVYVMVNKTRDLYPSKEPNVRSIHSLIPHSEKWHFPVGRLDKASTGLTILTNDPDQNNYLDSPFSKIEKEYHVKVHRIPKKTELTAIMKALKELQPEEQQKDVQVALHQKNTKNSWLSIVIFKGKLSQIRSILKEHKLEVLSFHRYRIGSLTSDEISPGAWKQMNEYELARTMGGDTLYASFFYKKPEEKPQPEEEGTSTEKTEEATENVA